MNIGFYDPISERWIKPRPERVPQEKPYVSMGEALLIALEAAALKERNDKIWGYLKQSAEGCNRPVIEDEPVHAPSPLVTEVPSEYEAVESLGYVYWKPKETA